MTEAKQKIIDEVLKDLKPNSHFETEHFIYWIKESYTYNGDSVSREEFKCIKDYVIEHGTVPCMLVPNPESDDVKDLKIRLHHKGYEYGNHYNRVLRYSKTYDCLEMYNHDLKIKAPYSATTDRVLVLAKKKKSFKVNEKNYVLIGGNRWLSLRNWVSFKNHSFHKVGVMKALMSAMLGGKDWVLNLDEVEGMSIQNKNSRKSTSVGEAIENECGAKPAKSLLKLMSVNEVIHLYSLINPKKIHSITNFVKQNKDNIEKLLNTCCEEKSKILLYYYFLCKDNRCEKSIVIDYLRMLSEEGEKLNLDISSYVTLKSRHDKISREILKKKEGGGKLKVAKIYPNIKSLPEMEVEKIKSARRLDHESEMLHHCVHGYKSQINSGYCAIYSIVFDDERYTLQINATKKKVDEDETPNWLMTGEQELAAEKEKKEGDSSNFDFKISQLKGRFNCDAPEAIKKSLELMCKNHDILPLEKSSIRFRTHDIDGMKETKKKIVQRGAAILDDLVSGRTRNKAVAEHLPF